MIKNNQKSISIWKNNMWYGMAETGIIGYEDDLKIKILWSDFIVKSLKKL